MHVDMWLGSGAIFLFPVHLFCCASGAVTKPFRTRALLGIRCIQLSKKTIFQLNRLHVAAVRLDGMHHAILYLHTKGNKPTQSINGKPLKIRIEMFFMFVFFDRSTVWLIFEVMG
ncbi:hypothetical protein [Desulfobulbus alkaliphilus]|uniref:hypothetical protein n=1 Tax=Desulfobulbus alkaliphilus TaxID=869814 RepID=UPI001964B582|nr:hypothetical protein [Desulfobulbus alkaliphilus]MBM9536260.1 hypothetical protein [Desulfobulbus alkaliphilus]